MFSFLLFQDNKASLKQARGHDHKTQYFSRDSVLLSLDYTY